MIKKLKADEKSQEWSMLTQGRMSVSKLFVLEFWHSNISLKDI